ncbi:CaiB/BaiF CoA transferase family protein [Chloroflexota bacterium]
MAGPLDGIRVLDLSWILAGPYCTMILSDLGAEIIKVERPGTGDLARGNGPFIDGVSSYFLSLNRGKKSISIDLQTPRGKELCLELASKSDILVENFVPGTMERLGLDYNTVSKQNPKIIYASISGFGQTGPYAQTRALDIVVQAMSGMMSVTGEPDGQPLKPGVSLGDITAGMYTAIGILAAVNERKKSGKGQMLDISMLDCQIATLENAFARYFNTGETPGRYGSRHPSYTPFQAFQTKDSYIVVAMVGGTRNQWQMFCAITGLLDMVDDERYQTGESRTQHYEELEPVLNKVFLSKTSEQWIKELTDIGIPCGPINNIDQAANHPQVIAREMIAEMPHPVAGKVKLVNTPLKLSRTPGKIKGVAPELGQDTADILAELLNMTGDEIDRLKEEKVI